MNTRLALVAAAATVVWACHSERTKSVETNGSRADASAVNALPADNQPNIDAQFPATAHANRQIALLAVHKGDRFPPDTMEGEAGDAWKTAAIDESQALVYAQSGNRDVAAEGFKDAEKSRLIARQYATVAAVVVAIRREPMAWRLDGGYLRSSEAWIRIGAGPDCVWIGHIMAGEMLGCGERTDIKDALWTIVTNARRAGGVNANATFAPAAQPGIPYARQGSPPPPQYAPEPVDAGEPPDPPQSGPFRDSTRHAPQGNPQ